MGLCAPTGPNANLAVAGSFTFALGGSSTGNSGIWRVIEMKSTHDVERKIKVAVYLTKAKQGKSDIWKQFSSVNEKMGKSST